MAIDPSISLDVRPPQFNIQIPNPLQQFGQVLSLGNLMQQRQLFPIELQTKQLGLEQLQQQIQERKVIGQILADEWGRQTPATAPGTAPAPAAPLPAPIPSIAALPNATAPIPPVAALPNTGILNAPMGTMDITPPAPPVAAPTTPITAPAATLQGAPALPGADIPQGAAQAPSLGFSPQVYARIIREAPLTGPAFVETMAKQVKAQYDQLHAQYGAQQDAAQREATLIQGINDEPTKLAAVGQMSNEKLISPQERDRMLGLPYNDPYFKSRANMALSRSDFLTQEQKAVEEARAAEKSRYEISQRPVQERKAGAEADKAETEALQGELTAGAQSFATVNDPKQLVGWLANVGPRAQQVYLKGFQNLPPNASLDDVRDMVGNTLNATKRAEIQAEQAKYQPVVENVIKGSQAWEGLDSDTRKIITPMLNARGFTGVAQPLSDDERNRLSAYDRALTIAQDTKEKLKDPETRDLMGPHSWVVTPLPWAEAHKKLQAHLLLQQQGLKKFISDGSIRGLNPETLGDIFPNVSTLPKVADSQLDDLINVVTKERNSYIQSLAGKAIPKSMQSAPAPSPAATPPANAPVFGPPRVKIVSPESAASSQPSAGLSSAQQQALSTAGQPPPGKVPAIRPDGKGGWKGGFVNAKDVDAARRQGVIVP